MSNSSRKIGLSAKIAQILKKERKISPLITFFILLVIFFSLCLIPAPSQIYGRKRTVLKPPRGERMQITDFVSNDNIKPSPPRETQGVEQKQESYNIQKVIERSLGRVFLLSIMEILENNKALKGCIVAGFISLFAGISFFFKSIRKKWDVIFSCSSHYKNKHDDN